MKIFTDELAKNKEVLKEMITPFITVLQKDVKSKINNRPLLNQSLKLLEQS